jgi:hypothetical protein
MVVRYEERVRTAVHPRVSSSFYPAQTLPRPRAPVPRVLRCRRTDARDSTVGSECRPGVFPANPAVR